MDLVRDVGLAVQTEEENDQVGGARLRVTPKGTLSGEKRFKGAVETVSLEVEIPKQFTTLPNGPQLFGEAIVELVDQNVPSTMVKENVRAGVKFESSEILDPMGFAFKPMGKISSEDIVTCMEAMSQSNKSVLNVEVPKILVHITYLNPPSGSGEEGVSSTKKRIGIEDMFGLPGMKKVREDGEIESEESGEESESEAVTVLKPKESHLMKNNVEDNCLFHAVYQALAYREYMNDKFDTVKKNAYRRSLQKSDMRDSCHDVYNAVNEMKKTCGITKSRDFDRQDIKQLQEKVFDNKFQIVCFIKNSTLPYFAGKYVGKNKQLYLYLKDGHYCGVRSVQRLLRTNYYCSMCNVKYRDVAAHYNCSLLHHTCGQEKCDSTPQDEKRKCEQCFVTFRSEMCYNNHLKKGVNGGKSRCDYTKHCFKCKTSYYCNKHSREHVCGTSFCFRCQKDREKGHMCTMQISVKNESKLTRKRLYFDFESRADETGKQIPVLFVALRCCPRCSHGIPKDIRSARVKKCKNCGKDGRLKVIECLTPENVDVDVAKEASEYIFGDHHSGFVAVAHNASGYDAQFILESMIASNKAAPEVCTDGTKLIFMKHNNVRLLDSLKYLTMSLSEVGKTFQVDSVKGDFPVLFIKPENYDYVGPIPDDKYYALDNKSPAVKKQLEEFLKKEREANKTFNFMDEIMKYCFNDVYILAVAMSTFEKAFESMTEVCLLEETTTAASAAALVFRRNHLDDKKKIVLDAKPSVSINNSVRSQKYLAWIGSSEDVQINISTTYGEEKVGNHRVDGFIPPCPKYENGKVIEYFGCYYHAHTCKYSGEDMIGEKNARDIWEADEKRLEELRQHYEVDVVYECEVKAELRQNKEMADFFESYEVVDLLRCEKALVGGRTEVFRLFMTNEGKLGYYVDVVSLYPTVMKHEAYPVGKPIDVNRNSLTVPMDNPEDIPFEGFLSCRVLAPNDLQLPVLPGKMNHRLMFFLCGKCAGMENQSKCTHSEKERSFTGTYTTVELKKALSLGYKILEVFHGVKYEKWVKNDASGQGGLFTSYINQMMEEKIYSSGWPADVVTDEEKKKFCQVYMEKEHINLNNFARFAKNAGKRAVAKLMLNSLWGKFAQNVDRVNTEIIIDPGKFWAIVHDKSLVLIDVRPVNDCLVVKYRQQEETLTSLRTSAVHLAAYTTAYARLRLYRLMEIVGADNILYTDTDSIIYTVPTGHLNPLENEMGSLLGQLTNELSGVMTGFVTTGPKTYAYVDLLPDGTEKVVTKAKGITINSQVQKKITFARMREMVDEVLAEVTPRTVLSLPQHIMRRGKAHNVFSKDILKDFKYTFNKRRVLSDGSTLPFGYFE